MLGDCIGLDTPALDVTVNLVCLSALCGIIFRTRSTPLQSISTSTSLADAVAVTCSAYLREGSGHLGVRLGSGSHHQWAFRREAK